MVIDLSFETYLFLRQRTYEHSVKRSGIDDIKNKYSALEWYGMSPQDREFTINLQFDMLKGYGDDVDALRASLEVCDPEAAQSKQWGEWS